MRIRKVAALLGALLSGAGFIAGRASEAFAFESFERRVASDTDVDGAARALSARLPMETALSAYEEFFQTLGGHCAEVADARRFPNTLSCVYGHGHVVRAEWRLVVRYDPVKMASTAQTLTYGLTGP